MTLPETDFDSLARTDEELVLFSMAFTPDRIDEAKALLNPNDFAEPVLRELFQLLCDMSQAGDSITIPSIANEAKKTTNDKRSLYDRITRERFSRIFFASVNAGHFEYHAKRVKSDSHRRQLVALGAYLDDAADPNADPNQIEAEIRNALDRITSSLPQRTKTWSQLSREYIDELSKKRQSPSVFSGLVGLDESTGGFLPGEMVVLAARPGMGKTALGVQIATHNAMAGRHCLYVSLEMQGLELLNRVVCRDADIDSRLVRTRRLNDSERQALTTTAESYKNWPLDVYDWAGSNIDQIHGVAQMLKRTKDLKLIVVDYIGLIEGTGTEKRYEQVSQISRRIKRMAGQLGCPVLALAQLNRDADGTRPKLSNLRDSGSIEQDADVVLFLHKDSQAGDLIIVEKHRHGETGDIAVSFDRERTRFTEPNASYQWPVGGAQ